MIDCLEIHLIHSKQEYEEVLKIRNTVFVKEQKVPLEIEFDGLDNVSEHVIVRFKNKTVGCARIRTLDSKIKLERIAILKEYRRRGFGKLLMKYLISHYRKTHKNGMNLHAQYYLKDFYRRFGFKVIGKPFMEAGIKHIEMHITEYS